jgi:hypothetical protein
MLTWRPSQPQDRTGHGAVVAERVDHLARRKLEPQRRDAQRMVRRARDLRVGGSEARSQRHPGRPRAEQEAATIHPRSRGGLLGHPVSPFKCWTVRPAPKVWNASPFHVQFRMAMDSKKPVRQQSSLSEPPVPRSQAMARHVRSGGLVSRFRSSHHHAHSLANSESKDPRACTHEPPNHVRFRANRTPSRHRRMTGSDPLRSSSR